MSMPGNVAESNEKLVGVLKHDEPASRTERSDLSDVRLDLYRV